MHFCTVNGNCRVMICRLSSAYWQQASNLSSLRCFESIWKDWDQYNKKNFFFFLMLSWCWQVYKPYNVNLLYFHDIVLVIFMLAGVQNNVNSYAVLGILMLAGVQTWMLSLLSWCWQVCKPYCCACYLDVGRCTNPTEPLFTTCAVFTLMSTLSFCGELHLWTFRATQSPSLTTMWGKTGKQVGL